MLNKIFGGQSKLEKLARKDLEYRYYAEALSSIERGEKDKGVWAKALADAGGDLDKTQAKYIELIVEKMMLATEAENEIEANLAKEEEVHKNGLEAQEGDADGWGIFWYFFPGLIIAAITLCIGGIVSLLS